VFKAYAIDLPSLYIVLNADAVKTDVQHVDIQVRYRCTIVVSSDVHI